MARPRSHGELASTYTLFCRLVPQYNMQFYLQYLATWPEYFMVEEAPHGQQLTSYSKCLRPTRSVIRDALRDTYLSSV